MLSKLLTYYRQYSSCNLCTWGHCCLTPLLPVFPTPPAFMSCLPSIVCLHVAFAPQPLPWFLCLPCQSDNLFASWGHGRPNAIFCVWILALLYLSSVNDARANLRQFQGPNRRQSERKPNQTEQKTTKGRLTLMPSPTYSAPNASNTSSASLINETTWLVNAQPLINTLLHRGFPMITAVNVTKDVEHCWQI